LGRLIFFIQCQGSERARFREVCDGLGGVYEFELEAVVRRPLPCSDVRDPRVGSWERESERRDAAKQAQAWLGREAARAEAGEAGARRPSAEAQQEQPNADKNFDPTAVTKNAGKYFPP
jgi:hypothetical protein